MTNSVRLIGLIVRMEMLAGRFGGLNVAFPDRDKRA